MQAGIRELRLRHDKNVEEGDGDGTTARRGSRTATRFLGK